MAVKTCPKCSGKVSISRNECPHCGYNFLESKECPDCGKIVGLNVNECPDCGYYFDVGEECEVVKEENSSLKVVTNIPIQNSNTSSSNIFLAKFHRKITKEQFLRSVMIELSLDQSSPTDILSAEFGEVEESEVQGYLVQGVANGHYSGIIGIDRTEEYVEQESRYVPSGTHYTSGGIGYYEKEGARHLVDVTKTRIVTDWTPHNGQIINESHSAVITEEEYIDFEKSFWKLFRSDDLNEIHDESIYNEKLPTGLYDKGIKLLRDDVVSTISWPGDHIKDESYSVNINGYKIYKCLVPTYKVNYTYKGITLTVEGIAVEGIPPVLEIPQSSTTNSVEGLKQKEKSEIEQRKKMLLISKIIAIVSAVSGFVGFIVLVSNGWALLWFIGLLVGLVASVAIAVYVYIMVNRIKNEYEQKIQSLSFMKYVLLEQMLTKSNFPKLTDEEKELLQSIMGVDSLDDIDESKILEQASFDEEETVTANKSIKIKEPKTKRDRKKLTKKQIGIIGLMSGLIICITLSILTFTIFIPNSQPFVFKENGDGYSLEAINKIDSPDVVIPETYKGKPVTYINSVIFYKCKDKVSITSITIPDTVTFISYNAFWGCTNVESITGPVLNSESFGDIFGSSGVPVSLKEVIITSGTSIESCEFYGLGNLIYVTIPDSVTTIGSAAFGNCANLAYVYYCGTYNEWNNIEISNDNVEIEEEIIYYYSETEPTEEGNYWHYVDEVPTVWDK